MLKAMPWTSGKRLHSFNIGQEMSAIIQDDYNKVSILGYDRLCVLMNLRLQSWRTSLVCFSYIWQFKSAPLRWCRDYFIVVLHPQFEYDVS